VDEQALQLGERTRGCAVDQRMSGDQARCELGCTPLHIDLIAEVS
jgi:hypothetical protein